MESFNDIYLFMNSPGFDPLQIQEMEAEYEVLYAQFKKGEKINRERAEALQEVLTRNGRILYNRIYD